MVMSECDQSQEDIFSSSSPTLKGMQADVNSIGKDMSADEYIASGILASLAGPTSHKRETTRNQVGISDTVFNESLKRNQRNKIAEMYDFYLPRYVPAAIPVPVTVEYVPIDSKKDTINLGTNILKKEKPNKRSSNIPIPEPAVLLSQKPRHFGNRP